MAGYPDQNYFDKVNLTLLNLRAYLLGLSYNFSQVMPKDSSLTDEAKAQQLADRLFFCLTSVGEEICESNYKDARSWLYHIIFYMISRCRYSDQTFSYLIRVSELSQGTRHILFSDEGMGACIAATRRNSPISKNDLEKSIVALISSGSKAFVDPPLLTYVRKELETHWTVPNL